MTRSEFDTWIEQHYDDLLKVARRRTNNDEDAADVVHNAVAGAIEGGWYAATDKPWTRMALALRSYASRRRETEQRHADIRRAAKVIQATRASLGWKRPKRGGDQ